MLSSANLECTSVQSVGVFVGGYGILPYPRHPLKSSHRIHRIHGSFWRRMFSHGFHRCSQKLVPLWGCTCLRSALPLARARSALTEQTCHLFCLCSRDSCTPWLAAWVWQGCHTLLICAHLCLSVGGTSLPEGSVCSAYSVGTLSVCFVGAAEAAAPAW